MPEILLVRHAESKPTPPRRGRATATPASAPPKRAGGGFIPSLRASASTQSSLALTRAYETAAAFSDAPEIEEDLIEIDLGRWEGVLDTVAEKDGVLLHPSTAAPTSRSADRRADERGGCPGVVSVDRLAERVGETSRAVVVTHGGARLSPVDAASHGAPPPHRWLERVAHPPGRRPGHWRLKRFNVLPTWAASAPAARHLGRRPVVALIRHGRTAPTSTAASRVSPAGASTTSGGAGRLWRSGTGASTASTPPLAQAADTAAAISATAVPVDGLKEIGLGVWEGLTWKEVGRLGRRRPQDLRRAGTPAASTVRPGRRRPGAWPRPSPPQAARRDHRRGHPWRGDPGLHQFLGDTTDVNRLAAENTSVTHVAMTADSPVLCALRGGAPSRVHDGAAPR